MTRVQPFFADLTSVTRFSHILHTSHCLTNKSKESKTLASNGPDYQTCLKEEPYLFHIATNNFLHSVLDLWKRTLALKKKNLKHEPLAWTAGGMMSPQCLYAHLIILPSSELVNQRKSDQVAHGCFEVHPSQIYSSVGYKAWWASSMALRGRTFFPALWILRENKEVPVPSRHQWLLWYFICSFRHFWL